MTYSKTQHEEARQEAADLIAKALQILEKANKQAMADKLWEASIPKTDYAINSISQTASDLLPPPTETR